ncbi:uncharacterized protein LOC129593771 [Paramacrobiotus metropolitanus]|uniref:uncharacterized protein LOC129593771 n=1 Tax=Paramacrobiotus metropolitanus TaxID=2943436 RepID=UPI002445DC49|nr:uncharacterized protein LOC129593771 [Paramacrobiotus metropolitanus]
MDGNVVETQSDADKNSTKHSLIQLGSNPIPSASELGSDASQPLERLDEQRQLEEGVLELLIHHQLASIEGTDDGVLCCIMYTFQKDLPDLRSLAWNDYGQGKLQEARLALTGDSISPLPAWLENGVRLQVFFEEKVTADEPPSSDDSSEEGFEVPWRARIQLQRVPDGCVFTVVQLAFINPDNCGSPTVEFTTPPIDATNLYCINNALKNIQGQTYSECCQELGNFREAYCYVTMRVPLQRILWELVAAFRLTIPEGPRFPEGDADGTDKVVLKMRNGQIETDRNTMVRLSPKARGVFATRKQGKVSHYEWDYSLEAVQVILDATGTERQSLAIDPHRADPFLLYEAMKLALNWEIQQLTMWTQVAFVERLCSLNGVSLEQIPVLEAVRLICDHADPKVVGSRMILCVLVTMLRIRHSPAMRWTLDELENSIAGKPELWKNVLQPTRLVTDTNVFITIQMRTTLTVAVNLGYWVCQLKCRIHVIYDRFSYIIRNGEYRQIPSMIFTVAAHDR